jgi:hypothetical protein
MVIVVNKLTIERVKMLCRPDFCNVIILGSLLFETI